MNYTHTENSPLPGAVSDQSIREHFDDFVWHDNIVDVSSPLIREEDIRYPELRYVLSWYYDWSDLVSENQPFVYPPLSEECINLKFLFKKPSYRYILCLGEQLWSLWKDNDHNCLCVCVSVCLLFYRKITDDVMQQRLIIILSISVFAKIFLL